jgi:inward rectifier potassium channel
MPVLIGVSSHVARGRAKEDGKGGRQRRTAKEDGKGGRQSVTGKRDRDRFATMPRRIRHQPKPIQIGPSGLGLAKLGASRFDITDPYHLAVSLSWGGFTLLLLAMWVLLNLVFAALYWAVPADVANMRPGSFSDAFFFSTETLATVGYGVMAPDTLYGHSIAAIETVTGLAFTAIMTGLLFVRFSRARPKIAYAEDVVVTGYNGLPTLMLRVANARATLMSAASARVFVLLAESTSEGGFFRRMHELRLVQSHLPMFVLPWTLMHVIDADSPLAGHTTESLQASGARLFLTLEARDHVLAAVVQDMRDFPAHRIRFGMRFVDSVMLDDQGRATADLRRIGLIEAAEEATEPTVAFE